MGPQAPDSRFHDQVFDCGPIQLMQIKFGAKSDTGSLRVQNEDSFLAKDKVFVVADGMGGHNAGEVASAMATKMLESAGEIGIANAEQLSEIIKRINKSIFEASANQTDQRGMGTTLTAVAVTSESGLTTSADTGKTAKSVGASVTVANIGDSRTYLLRNGEFRQVSVDHSYVQELVSEGLITKEEARTHARRNIVTRALGIEPEVSIDTWTLPIVNGDRYLLCSDGLVDEVTDDVIEQCVRQQKDPQSVAEELVVVANQNGGRDNITVVVVDVLTDPEVASQVVVPKSPKGLRHQLRTIAVLATIAVLCVVGVTFIASYLRSGYFVAYENQNPEARVLVYRGKNFLWVNPTIEADSTLKREDLSVALGKEILAKPSFSTSSDARDYVNQIRDVIEVTNP